MKDMIMGIIILLVIALFIIANFFDKCKCGAQRLGSGGQKICRHCKEELVPKYPYARKIFMVLAIVLLGLILLKQNGF